MLAPHFSAAELGADQPDIPASAQANLWTVAAWLESARGALATPLDKVSGWRSVAHNAAVGGSSTSDHINGLAADFTPRGVSIWGAWDIFKTGVLPEFDQVIFYPVDGHIHVGLGPRMRGEFRVSLLEGGYPLLTPELEAKLRGSLPLVLVALVIGLILYAVTRSNA